MEVAAPPTTAHTSSVSKRLAWLLVIFFAALLPILPDLVRYHGDERYYTDAAIEMLRSGDYVTPRYAHGAERLNKPLLTYWVLCASYKALGIGLFSSRLPFLLAGCGVLWLTWRLAVVMFGPGEPPLLAALVLAANVQTMTIAGRSTPDMLLCLFLTASLCGFAELLLSASDNWKSFALAYVGAGLACATKGLWGVLPVIFSFLFWMFALRPRPRLRRVAPVRWLLIGAALGLSWFVMSAALHGVASLKIFIEDQTTADAEPARWFVLSNFTEYLWATLRHFLPWTAFGILAWLTNRASVREFAKANARAIGFGMGWYALVFILFCFGLVQRTRYLLPTYPGVAACLGALIACVVDQPRFIVWLRRLFTLLAAAGLTGGMFAIVLGSRIELRLLFGGIVLALAATVLLLLSRRFTPAVLLNAMGFFTVATFSIGTLCWRPIGGLNPAPELTRALSAPSLAHRPLAALGIPPVINSQIRLLSGGSLDPQEISVMALDDKLPPNTVLLVGENWRIEVATAGYQLQPAGYRVKRVGWQEIRKAWRSGRREDSFDSNRQNFYIATRS